MPGRLLRGAATIPIDRSEADHWSEGDFSAPTVEINKEITGIDVALHQTKQVIGQALGHRATCVTGEHASQVEPIHVGRGEPHPCSIGKGIGDGDAEERPSHSCGVESGEDLPHSLHPFILVAMNTGHHQQRWTRVPPGRHERPQDERLT